MCKNDSDKGILVQKTQGVTHKEADVSLEVVSFPRRDTKHELVCFPRYPTRCLYIADGNRRNKQEADEEKRPTGLAWLGLISTYIYAKKYLASHD